MKAHYYGIAKNGKALVYASDESCRLPKPEAVRWPFMLAFVVTLLMAVMAIKPF